MCDIHISTKACKALKSIGCNKDRFLRLHANTEETTGYTACIDSNFSDCDEVLLDTKDFRVVSDIESVPRLDGVTVDFDSHLTIS